MRTFVAIVGMALLLGSAAAQTATKKKSASATKKLRTPTEETSEDVAMAEARKAAGATKPGVTNGGSKPVAGPTDSEKKGVDTKPASSKVEQPKSAKSGTSSGSAKTGSATKKTSETTTTKKGAKTAPSAAPTKRETEKAKADEAVAEKPPQDNAGEDPKRRTRVIGPNITLDPSDLAGFEDQSKPVQRLITAGLELTRKNLTYRYGSSDPSTGGMDCSGTIYYLLKAAGVKEPPRDSSGLYLWAQKAGTLRRVNPATLDDDEMDDLQPGDLMFWEGTYEVQRDPPISHTMIYLGREKTTGIRVMVGASDGRSYAGLSRNGVSVFDFQLPREGSTAKFVGYARVPGLENAASRR